MNQFFAKLLGLSRLRRPISKRPITNRARLEVENLEARDVPTAGIFQNGYAVTVQATDKGDKVVFSYDQGDPNTMYDDKVMVQWTRGDTGQTQTQTFNVYTYKNYGDGLKPFLNVNTVTFNGGEGADKVWNNTALFSKLFGMGGNDELHGGSGPDQIQGGRGSDHVYGNDGMDNLDANGPSQGGSDPDAIDYVYGGKGGDDIRGGFRETNMLFGEGDIDHIWGGDDATNYEYGGASNDTLRGGKNGAVNFLYGGAGNDWMIGGSADFGADKVFNQMIDDEGQDTFIGGDRAFNMMNATDGGSPGQGDTIVRGVINSVDMWWGDANDFVWQLGYYPISPP